VENSSSTQGYEPTKVSLRITAPVERLFEILADPGRHIEFDGSGMLRGAISNEPIGGVGDKFYMKMHFNGVGDYVTVNHVVEFERDRRIAWEPAPGDATASGNGSYPIGLRTGQRWSYELVPDGPDCSLVTEIFDCSDASDEFREFLRDGEYWIDSMEASLQKLELLSRQQ
jgi:hypothetical protein